MDELEDAPTQGSAKIGFDASGVPVIRLAGEIDISNVDALRAEIEPVVLRAPDRVVFDLGDLDFLDSSGIALLLSAAAHAGSVQLLRPSALVRRVIELTGLAGVLQVDE